MGVLAIGGLTIFASLLFYQSILYYYPVGTQNIGFLQQIASVVLALVLLGIFASVAGATNYFMRQPSRPVVGSSSLTLTTLSLALNDKHSFRAFVLSALIYGLLFAFFSSLIVYRPFGVFSYSYGVNVPSALSVLCCGGLGQMPQFVIYLTQQFAILIIPTNLILLVTVSWLVGLNAGIGVFAYKNRPEAANRRWMWGFGAIVGLFTACPSCAGFFLLTMLGLTGAVGLALTFSSLQGAFIGVGLPILIITPILTSRRIPSNRECLIKVKDSTATKV
jgi:hypothetical protein